MDTIDTPTPNGLGAADRDWIHRFPLLKQALVATGRTDSLAARLAANPTLAVRIGDADEGQAGATTAAYRAATALAEAKRCAENSIGLCNLFGLAEDRQAVEERLVDFEAAREWYDEQRDFAALAWLNLAICHQNLQLGRLGGLHELCETDTGALPSALATRVEVARSIVATFFGAPCNEGDRQVQLRGFPGAIASAVESLLLGQLNEAVDRSRFAQKVACERRHYLGSAIARLSWIVAESLRANDKGLTSEIEFALLDLERCEAPEVVGLAYLLYGTAKFQNGHGELGLIAIDQAKAIFQRLNAFPFIALAQVCQAWIELGTGDLAASTAVLQAACSIFDRLGALRGGIWARYFLAEAQLRAGHFPQAIATLRQTLFALEGETNYYVRTLALSRLGVALARNGQHGIAMAALRDARESATRCFGAPLELVIALDSLTVEALDQVTDPLLRRRRLLLSEIEARGLLQHHPIALSIVLQPIEESPSRPEVDIEAGTVSVGGHLVHLGRSAAARRIVGFLAERSEPASVHELFEAGWPGQTAEVEIAANRVYNTIYVLRKLGLDAYLVHDGDGYRLTAR